MTEEPVLKGEDGQTLTKDDIWELYTSSLLEHRGGSEELLQILVQLGMSDIEEQKRFIATATEFKVLAQESLGMTVNYVQLFHLAQKWGTSMERMKQLKKLLAPDADLKF